MFLCVHIHIWIKRKRPERKEGDREEEEKKEKIVKRVEKLRFITVLI